MLIDFTPPKMTKKLVLFVKIGKMEKLKIEWKALDIEGEVDGFHCP